MKTVKLFLRVALKKFQYRLSKKRPLFWTLFWVYLGALVFFSVVGDRSLKASYRLWREKRRLNQEIVALRSETVNLRKEIGLFRGDRRTIEKYAREELHLVGKNEIHYIFP